MIVKDIDLNRGLEILVPSWGLTYYGLKILAVSNNKLRIIGEVEGFEHIFQSGKVSRLVGHKIVDGAILDPVSETYFLFTFDDKNNFIR
ncbi:hypothetical protein ES705_45390 [subsurface metagenome]